MALSDQLKQLAKKPLWYQIAVYLLFVAVGGLLYYQCTYSENYDQKKRLEQRRTNLLNKQRQLNEDLEEQKRLAEKNQELQRTIRDNQKALPTEAELPAFFDHLQRKAGDAGITIRNWKRLDEEAVDIYVRVPVEMEISGTFYDIMMYFALLGPQRSNAMPEEDEEERVDERIVSISDLSLGSPALEDGEIRIVAKFIASTFRQQNATGDQAGTTKNQGRRGRRR